MEEEGEEEEESDAEPDPKTCPDCKDDLELACATCVGRCSNCEDAIEAGDDARCGACHEKAVERATTESWNEGWEEGAGAAEEEANAELERNWYCRKCLSSTFHEDGIYCTECAFQKCERCHLVRSGTHPCHECGGPTCLGCAGRIADSNATVCWFCCRGQLSTNKKAMLVDRLVSTGDLELERLVQLARENGLMEASKSFIQSN